MLEAQNKRIDDLVERIKQQQEKMDKQNIRIRTLQNQVIKKYYDTKYTYKIVWLLILNLRLQTYSKYSCDVH